MEFNLDYFKSLIEVGKLRSEYSGGRRELPYIAQKFIQMGKEQNVHIEIGYGVNPDGDDLIAGYFINAVDKNKSIFIQDIYVEDTSDENITKAIKWMKTALKDLEKY